MSREPENHGARMSFADTMSYTDYLGLDGILDAQRPLSDAHDEMLFIIQHQTSELWMKLAQHELNAARDAIGADNLPRAFKTLARVARIFEQLNSAWDVLRTMTPADYTQFRESLGQSSGFQSHQYRLIEFTLGNRNRSMLKPHTHRPDLLATLEAELARPSLYDVALKYVSDQGIDVPKAVLSRELSARHTPDEGVTAAWQVIYEDTSRYWALYDLAEKLVDIEDYFRRWRFNHVTTVERVIGLKRGTGGTGACPICARCWRSSSFPSYGRSAPGFDVVCLRRGYLTQKEGSVGQKSFEGLDTVGLMRGFVPTQAGYPWKAHGDT